MPGFTTTERAIWNTYIAEINTIPEPSTYALFALGLVSVVVVGRKAKRD